VTNGLDALKKQNERNKGGGRKVPPPRHRPRETPVELPSRNEEAEAAVDSPPPPPNPAPPATAERAQPIPPQEPAKVVSPAPAPAPAPTPEAEPQAETKKPRVAPSTIYFDAETDDWLEQACTVGRQGRPKVDTRSGFARLAVRLLAATMTPEEAVAELRRNAGSSTSHTGRPRL
jgi:hypothetical protein